MSKAWRKSTYSSPGGNNCVETRRDAGSQLVRDSKLGDVSPIFELGSNDYTALLANLK